MAAPLDRVKALLASLPREDQEDLTRFLHDILVTPEEAEARHVASLQERPRGGGRPVTYTFRTEWIRCGKKGCWCGESTRGEGHGPYTYKYWKESGRLRKQYVGKAAKPAGDGAGGVRVRRRGGASRAGPVSGSTAASSNGRAPRA